MMQDGASASEQLRSLVCRTLQDKDCSFSACSEQELGRLVSTLNHANALALDVSTLLQAHSIALRDLIALHSQPSCKLVLLGCLHASLWRLLFSTAPQHANPEDQARVALAVLSTETLEAFVQLLDKDRTLLSAAGAERRPQLDSAVLRCVGRHAVQAATVIGWLHESTDRLWVDEMPSRKSLSCTVRWRLVDSLQSSRLLEHLARLTAAMETAGAGGFAAGQPVDAGADMVSPATAAGAQQGPSTSEPAWPTASVERGVEVAQLLAAQGPRRLEDDVVLLGHALDEGSPDVLDDCGDGMCRPCDLLAPYAAAVRLHLAAPLEELGAGVATQLLVLAESKRPPEMLVTLAKELEAAAAVEAAAGEQRMRAHLQGRLARGGKGKREAEAAVRWQQHARVALERALDMWYNERRRCAALEARRTVRTLFSGPCVQYWLGAQLEAALSSCEQPGSCWRTRCGMRRCCLPPSPSAEAAETVAAGNEVAAEAAAAAGASGEAPVPAAAIVVDKKQPAIGSEDARERAQQLESVARVTATVWSTLLPAARDLRLRAAAAVRDMQAALTAGTGGPGDAHGEPNGASSTSTTGGGSCSGGDGSGGCGRDVGNEESEDQFADGVSTVTWRGCAAEEVFYATTRAAALPYRLKHLCDMMLAASELLVADADAAGAHAPASQPVKQQQQQRNPQQRRGDSGRITSASGREGYSVGAVLPGMMAPAVFCSQALSLMRPEAASQRVVSMWHAYVAAMHLSAATLPPATASSFFKELGLALTLPLPPPPPPSMFKADAAAREATAAAADATVADPAVEWEEGACSYSLRTALDAGLLPAMERLIRGSCRRHGGTAALPREAIAGALRASGRWPAVLAHGSVEEVGALVVTLRKAAVATRDGHPAEGATGRDCLGSEPVPADWRLWELDLLALLEQAMVTAQTSDMDAIAAHVKAATRGPYADVEVKHRPWCTACGPPDRCYEALDALLEKQGWEAARGGSSLCASLSMAPASSPSSSTRSSKNNSHGSDCSNLSAGTSSTSSGGRGAAGCSSSSSAAAAAADGTAITATASAPATTAHPRPPLLLSLYTDRCLGCDTSTPDLPDLVCAGGRPPSCSHAAKNQRSMAVWALSQWAPVLCRDGAGSSSIMEEVAARLSMARLLHESGVQCLLTAHYLARFHEDNPQARAQQERQRQQRHDGMQRDVQLQPQTQPLKTQQGANGAGCDCSNVSNSSSAASGASAASAASGASSSARVSTSGRRYGEPLALPTCSAAFAADTLEAFLTSWRAMLFRDCRVLHWAAAALCAQLLVAEEAVETGKDEVAEAVLDMLEVCVAAAPDETAATLREVPREGSGQRCLLLDRAPMRIMQAYGRNLLVGALLQQAGLAAPAGTARAAGRAHAGSASGAGAAPAVLVAHSIVGPERMQLLLNRGLMLLPAPIEALSAVQQAGLLQCSYPWCANMEDDCPAGITTPPPAGSRLRPRGAMRPCRRCNGAVKYCCGACALAHWRVAHHVECSGVGVSG